MFYRLNDNVEWKREEVGMRFLVLFIATLCLSSSVASDAVEPRQQKTFTPKLKSTDRADRCTVPLWNVGSDSKGLNVRASSKRRAPILGQLHTEAMFTATDSSHGWFEIKEPMVWNWPEAERIPMKNGPQTGWVFGGLVGIDTTCRRDQQGREVLTVYRRPTEKSPPVVTWIAGSDFSCDWTIKKALDCEGGWLKVLMTKNPGSQQAVEGWLHPENLCDNPLTTC